MRTLPRYLLTDVITVYRLDRHGGEVRTYDDGTIYRCRWEGTGRLRQSDDGRRRVQGGAKVWIPMRKRRRVRRREEHRAVDVGVRQVGSLVGSGTEVFPGDLAIMPFELAGERDVVSFVDSVEDFEFSVEDRVVRKRTDREYQIVGVYEHHGPRGPDHLVLMLEDQVSG